jgi:ABC-type multidrug transport system ATPase subunit
VSDVVVRTDGLVKRYGRVTAVDDIALEVREGDRYGFLGANGSGKTTTIRMLLGLVHPTVGQVQLLGTGRLHDALPEVGALVEQPAGYGHLSGRTNLRLADAAGPGGSRRTRRARVEDALELVGLAGVDRRPVRAYSLGMRQRLGLAAALLRKPRLLVLDEPTNGLDPQGIREIRDLLTRLNEQGTTVFLSSHLLAEIEALCTRVGVMDRGRLVLQDRLDALGGPTGLVLVRTPDAYRVAALLGSAVHDVDGLTVRVRTDDPAGLNAKLVEDGVRVEHLVVEHRALEDVVLEATGAAGDRRDVA